MAMTSEEVGTMACRPGIFRAVTVAWSRVKLTRTAVALVSAAWVYVQKPQLQGPGSRVASLDSVSFLVELMMTMAFG